MSDEQQNPDENEAIPPPVEEGTDTGSEQPVRVIFSDGEAGTTRPRITSCDFSQPVLSIERELDDLKETSGVWVRRLAGKLALFLRSEFSLTVSGLKIEPYSEAAGDKGQGEHFVLFKAQPLPGLGFLRMDSRLALSVAGGVLGGEGAPPETERPLTEIERDLIGGFVDLVLEGWCGQWTDSETLEPEVAGHESCGADLHICEADVRVLSLSLEATYRGNTGTMGLVTPFYMIDPLVRKRQAARAARRKASAEREKVTKVRPGYHDIPVELLAVWHLGEREVGDVCGWSPGDVIPLSDKIFEETVLRAPGSAAFRCEAGVEGEKIAVAVKEKIQESR